VTVGPIRRLLAAAACLSALPLAAQGLNDYAGADRMDKIVAAAKKEGTLTLYTTIAEKDLPAIVKPFEDKYGVKVVVWRAGTDKVLQRAVQEARAGRNEMDAVHFGSPEMEALAREKVLAAVASPVHKDLLAGSVPSHRQWAATILSVWVQAYNTTLVKKSELPKSYQDLLDPKWKGKLGIEAKDDDWFATVVHQLGGEEKGLAFFRKLVETNGISVRKGHTLLTQLVVSGEIPLALTVYNYKAEQLKGKGAPIDWFSIGPAIARPNGVGVAKQAPHPHAAVLFYDFEISPEGQKILSGRDFVPTSKKVDTPLNKIPMKFVDARVALDEFQKWEKLYADLFTKGAR
jgi:iron(III) transport system substrate-binding protein